MIHRAPFGSLERFVAVLIEHCAGNFPLWLAPEQIAVLPISERFNDYGKKVLDILKERDIRGFLDERNEKIGRKIRDAEVNKVPFMLLVGEKEAMENTVAVRKHGEGDKGVMDLNDFMTTFSKDFALPS
jgi:threonyl-tRNA synthetase